MIFKLPRGLSGMEAPNLQLFLAEFHFCLSVVTFHLAKDLRVAMTS